MDEQSFIDKHSATDAPYERNIFDTIFSGVALDIMHFWASHDRI